MRDSVEDILKQDSYLKSNIANMISFARNKRGCKFTSFLDERQQMLSNEVLRHERWKHFSFYGGANGCERCMLAVFSPEYECCAELFPLKPIAVAYSEKAGKKLSHRDFLGALMSIQIKRETVGDMFIENELAIIFVKEDIAEFLIQNLTKVGSVSVSLSYAKDIKLEKKQEFKQISGTVSSLRLDCVVSLLSGKGRSSATELISMGHVKVEHMECNSIAKQLKGTETITIRGMGKFILTGEQKKTKKDRVFIAANHLL